MHTFAEDKGVKHYYHGPRLGFRRLWATKLCNVSEWAQNRRLRRCSGAVRRGVTILSARADGRVLKAPWQEIAACSKPRGLWRFGRS
jgi:hypothetical protein